MRRTGTAFFFSVFSAFAVAIVGWSNYQILNRTLGLAAAPVSALLSFGLFASYMLVYRRRRNGLPVAGPLATLIVLILIGGYGVISYSLERVTKRPAGLDEILNELINSPTDRAWPLAVALLLELLFLIVPALYALFARSGRINGEPVTAEYRSSHPSRFNVDLSMRREFRIPDRTLYHYDELFVDGGVSRVDQSQIFTRLSSPSHKFPPVASDKPERNFVCSVFAPAVVAPTKRFKLQVLIHRHYELMMAARAAASVDATANRRGVGPLAVALAVGQKIGIFVECAHLEIRDPVKEVIWDGSLAHMEFSARVLPNVEAGSVKPIVHVCVDGIPVGQIEAEIHIGHEDRQPEPHAAQLGFVTSQSDAPTDPGIAKTRPIYFEEAFISYARKDVQYVLLFAQGLAQHSVRIRLDVTSLEPGDDWAQRLPAEIEQCDVFYLMWSDRAAASPWVDKECRYAVQLREERKPEDRPRILPIVLHQPVASPPEHLAAFHFNSIWLAHRTAQGVGLFRTRRAVGRWLKRVLGSHD